MSKQLEVERRFLVKPITSWEGLSQLFDNLIDIKRIEQTYLKPKGDDPAARVRKTISGLSGDEKTTYDFNLKHPVETGTHQEIERSISEKQYHQYLEEAYPGKGMVEKTRFVFNYHDQEFELDVFKGKLKGMAILELEMNDKDDVIEMPPFLTVIEEVTENRGFNNFYLANKTR
jgi:CYTH domain-containing protein